LSVFKRISFALMSFLGLADLVEKPRPRKRLPRPSLPDPAPAVRRPKVIPQRVASWRKARQEVERITSLLERAQSFNRRAARPTIRRSAEFLRSAERLLSRVRAKEGRLSFEVLPAAA